MITTLFLIIAAIALGMLVAFFMLDESEGGLILIIVFVVALLLALIFYACAGDDKKGEVKTTAVQEQSHIESIQAIVSRKDTDGVAIGDYLFLKGNFQAEVGDTVVIIK